MKAVLNLNIVVNPKIFRSFQDRYILCVILIFVKGFSYFIKLNNRKIIDAIAGRNKFVIVVLQLVLAEIKLKIIFLLSN